MSDNMKLAKDLIAAFNKLGEEGFSENEVEILVIALRKIENMRLLEQALRGRK